MFLASQCAFKKFMAAVAVFSCFCKEFEMYDKINDFFVEILKFLHIINY